VQVGAAVARLAQDGAKARPVRGVPYADLINRVSTAHHLNPALVAAVVSVESNFNARAHSRRGAYGLMQVMPQTWRAFGAPVCAPETAHLTTPLCMDDPADNLDVGTAYLRSLLDRFGGDPLLALAAYNAGAEAVMHHAGVPPFPETTRYLRLVALAWVHLQKDGTLTPFWLGVIRTLHVWEHARVAVLGSVEAFVPPRPVGGQRPPAFRENPR
jgi:soluble lytic murein transglycosylase-like protein